MRQLLSRLCQYSHPPQIQKSNGEHQNKTLNKSKNSLKYALSRVIALRVTELVNKLGGGKGERGVRKFELLCQVCKVLQKTKTNKQ